MSLSPLDRILLARADEQMASERTRERELRPPLRAGVCIDCGRPTLRSGAVRCTRCSDRASRRAPGGAL